MRAAKALRLVFAPPFILFYGARAFFSQSALDGYCNGAALAVESAIAYFALAPLMDFLSLFVDGLFSAQSRWRQSIARTKSRCAPLSEGLRADFLALRAFSSLFLDDAASPLAQMEPQLYLRASQRSEMLAVLSRLGQTRAGQRAAARAAMAASSESLVRRCALFSRRWALKGDMAQSLAWAQLLAALLRACQINPADGREGFLPFLLLSFDFSRAQALLACAQAPGLDLSARAIGGFQCAEIVRSLSHGWLKAQQIEMEEGLCAISREALSCWIERAETVSVLPAWPKHGSLWALHRLSAKGLSFWPPSQSAPGSANRESSSLGRWAMGLAAQRVSEGSVHRRVFEALLGRVRSHADQRALLGVLGAEKTLAPHDAGHPPGSGDAQSAALRKAPRRL